MFLERIFALQDSVTIVLSRRKTKIKAFPKAAKDW